MKRMIIVLTSVMVAAGVVLAGTYTLLNPRIQKNQEEALHQSLNTLFAPQAKRSGGDGSSTSFQELNTPSATIYQATMNGKPIGYAVEVKGSGYGGTIRMLVGVAPDLKTITGLTVVDNVETPGLGGRITEPAFRDQFIGLNALSAISYVKNQKADSAKNQIEAISGATISSRAVVSALNATLSGAMKGLQQ